MNYQDQTRLEALRRAEALELRLQDARAQRQRASELFLSDLGEVDEVDDDASEALLACNDIVLFVRVGDAANRYEETVGEYASGAVRRFANLDNVHRHKHYVFFLSFTNRIVIDRDHFCLANTSLLTIYLY